MCAQYPTIAILNVLYRILKSQKSGVAASGLPNPTPVEGEVGFPMAQDQLRVFTHPPDKNKICDPKL